MFQKIVDPSGLSLVVNRVALPAVESFAETYKTLPDGLDIGFIGEVEGHRMAAVLCKNGGSEIPQNDFCESVPIVVEVAAISTVPEYGSRIIALTTGHSATNLPKDSLKNGYLWATRDSGVVEDKPLPRYLIKGNEAGAGAGSTVDIELYGSITTTFGYTTNFLAISSLFSNAKQSTTALGNKALGAPMVKIDPDLYFWSIFEGDMILDTGGGVNQGAMLKKAGTGQLTTATVSSEIVGRKRFGGSDDVVTLHVPGIRA